MLGWSPAGYSSEYAKELRVAAEARFERAPERRQFGVLSLNPHEALHALVVGIVPECDACLLVEQS